jgi:hypothetical protein
MKIINKILTENSLHNYIIYVDLDETLTDFNGAFKELGYGDEKEYKKKQTDFFKILSKGGEDFWSKMKWKKDGKDLWNHLKPYNPIILSSPTRDPKSISGKIKWIQRELGPHTKYILERDKFRYATPNSILIDDTLDKLIPWKEHGGIPILHTSTISTLAKLEKILEEQK